jgi:anhydro-N-acetylmuramic acid kinase
MAHNFRNLIGLSIGSGREGVDAALVRIDGVGLGMRPRVIKAQRLPFPPDLRDGLFQNPKLVRQRAVGDALNQAARRFSGEDAFAIGLLTPAGGPFATAAEAVADQSGLTLLAGFAARDIAAGGAGRPITAAADALLFQNPQRSRLLIHLGSTATLCCVKANSKLTDTIAFDAGPCGRFLDALVHRCTREKERCDLGGTRAVQGRASVELLERWRRERYFEKPPPKHYGPDLDEAFMTQAVEDARGLNLSLNDLLCTANHFIAAVIHDAANRFVPPGPREIGLSGGGVRNGFLRQIVAAKFPEESISLTDDFGVPSLARNAAAAAILAALTLDGVTGNLPLLTGAGGGRLIGRIVPGDPKNWAVVSAWAAEQLSDYLQFAKAA